METNEIKINLKETGEGKVILNGEDISNKIVGVMVLCKAGESPRIDLQLVSGVKLEAKGIIHAEEVKGK